MLHPLIHTLATRPGLLAEHLAGYGELITVQAGEIVSQVQATAVIAALAGLCAALGLIFGGVSLLLVGAVHIDDMPYPFLLLAVPLLFLALAGLCWLRLRQRPVALTLGPLREQVAADAALLREAGSP